MSPIQCKTGQAARAGALLSALTASLLGTAALATPAAPETCSAVGIDWRADPVYTAVEHPSQSVRPVGPVACAVEKTVDLAVEGVTLRLTLGKLRHGADGPELAVRMVDVARLETAGPTSLGRVLLSEDPIDRAMRFEPQARKVGDGILIRIAPRHPWLFRLEGGRLSEVAASGWRDAVDAVLPEAERQGAFLSVDLDRMEGRVAIRRKGTEPGRGDLPSAYEENRMAVAGLTWRNGALVADGVSVESRRPGDEPALDIFTEMDGIIRDGLKDLPPGVEPCSLGAWSVDTDPKGLNVRAAPNAQARVLGIVPPARRLPKQEAFGDDPVKAEFRIVGHRDGWFLVEKIEAPGEAYDAAYPRSLPQPFKGRGWISGRMAGAALANGGLPEGRLYVSPHADAASREILDAEGNRLGPDSRIKRLLACSGWWGLVETADGQRGWWRALCSNQATNCS